ncbi:MAG: hypothetical protein WCG25_06100 [bacterium]
MQKKLVSEISPLKQKEIQQKSDIKKSITDVKTKEIKIQNEQKEILKKDFQNQNSDLQNPIFQQTLAYFDQQIIMNQKLIKGEPIEMETPD